jgi:hypothetical protein
MTIARLTGDFAVRKLGPIRCVRIGGVLAGTGGVLVAVSRSPLPAIAGFVVIGLGVAVVLPLIFVAAANTTTNPGEGVAGAATVAYTAEFIAPGTIGLIGALSSLSGAFVLVAVIAAVMSVSAGVLRRGRVSPPAQEKSASPSAAL